MAGKCAALWQPGSIKSRDVGLRQILQRLAIRVCGSHSKRAGQIQCEIQFLITVGPDRRRFDGDRVRRHSEDRRQAQRQVGLGGSRQFTILVVGYLRDIVGHARIAGSLHRCVVDECRIRRGSRLLMHRGQHCRIQNILHDALGADKAFVVHRQSDGANQDGRTQGKGYREIAIRRCDKAARLCTQLACKHSHFMPHLTNTQVNRSKREA